MRNQSKKDRLTFSLLRAVSAAFDKVMKFRPPFLLIFSLVCKIRNITSSTCFKFIPCKQRVQFLMYLTRDFSSSNVSMAQYLFSSPVTTLPSRRGLIVLWQPKVGNRPLASAYCPLHPFSLHQATVSSILMALLEVDYCLIASCAKLRCYTLNPRLTSTFLGTFIFKLGYFMRNQSKKDRLTFSLLRAVSAAFDKVN